MSTEIRVPTLGESVTEATVAKWFKKPGEAVVKDEPLVELETDKVTLEVPAPASGTLAEIVADSGVTVGVAALLGQIAAGGAAAAPAPAAKAAPAPAKAVAPADNGPAVARMAAESGVDPATVAARARTAGSPRATCSARSRPASPPRHPPRPPRRSPPRARPPRPPTPRARSACA